MNVSIISIGMFASVANAYQPIYGNDYANISAFGLNENDFQKDNIIQKDGNYTNINIPKPKGTVNINILGSKKTINLDDDEKNLNKRKRYYKIQQNKKRQRLEEQRQADFLRAEQDAIEEQQQQAIEAQAKQFEEDKRRHDIAIQQSYEQNQNQRFFSSGDGFIPSTPPLGIPR